MEVTVQVENAAAVHVEPLELQLILLHGALNTLGIKLVANVLFLTKVEETLTLCFTTPTTLLMSDSGRSINPTGVNAQEDMLHVTLTKTLTAPSKFITGEEAPGNFGAPIQPVDVDPLHLLNEIHIFL